MIKHLLRIIIIINNNQIVNIIKYQVKFHRSIISYIHKYK